MANYKQLGALLCLLAAFPATAAGAGATCTPPGEQAAEAEGYYTKIVQTPSGYVVELWREANGAEGLQSLRHRCSDGSSWSPDFFVTSTPRDLSLSV